VVSNIAFSLARIELQLTLFFSTVVFKTFTSFLVTIYDICLSLHIDLTIIFRSINLNYQLFLDVGLNLAEILKLNGGTANVGQLPQGPQGSVQSATNAIKPQTHSTNLINNSQGTGSGGMGVNNGSIQSSAQDPSSILEAWNSVPIAFGKCRAVFQKKVSSSEALQAVSTLHATIQSFVSRYGACKPCDSMNHQDAFSVCCFIFLFRKDLGRVETLMFSFTALGPIPGGTPRNVDCVAEHTLTWRAAI
jgi:hypothetical protein